MSFNLSVNEHFPFMITAGAIIKIRLTDKYFGVGEQLGFVVEASLAQCKEIVCQALAKVMCDEKGGDFVSHVTPHL